MCQIRLPVANGVYSLTGFRGLALALDTSSEGDETVQAMIISSFYTLITFLIRFLPTFILQSKRTNPTASAYIKSENTVLAPPACSPLITRYVILIF
ncbi:hypothetical protein J3R83DRAFT_11987 [Lanmaoa asiatica]|nr:hypothetical protein J3R83DRAFT_11987 [Lanmaoa asiatica]